MIDNFELIKRMFYFNEGNDMFFHMQILRRGKDHPELPAANKLIKSYLVRSKKHLESLREEVTFLCEHYKARAYINVAGKDFDKLNTLLLAKLANNVHLNNVVDPIHILNSAIGELKSRCPMWVVDVDDMSIKQQVHDWIYNWFLIELKKGLPTLLPKECFARDRIKAEIPTKNGCHLITNPFDLAKFKEEFPDVDVHKNNPTILYIPKSLDD